MPVWFDVLEKFLLPLLLAIIGKIGFDNFKLKKRNNKLELDLEHFTAI